MLRIAFYLVMLCAALGATVMAGYIIKTLTTTATAAFGRFGFPSLRKAKESLGFPNIPSA